ncbi:MAG: hypothetical protein DRI46_11095 [Chloroflexi bacterium]|nr:MAG: hypothetical protein DRI46_11095 [Chloroflexota bacterium]
MAIEVFSTEGSTRVTGITYDTVLLKLTVQFKRGGSYVYEEVPLEVFNALKTSPSIGKAINGILKTGDFKYYKL